MELNGRQRYFLGVDGGNTKTIALVGRSDGAVVGWGRAGCSDIYALPVPQARASLLRAVHAALEHANIAADHLAAGAFSMAGADWPEDIALLTAMVEQAGFGRAVRVVNDSIGALRAGTDEAYGVSIVCGTGIATGARGVNGQIWHSSFWQVPQGGEQLGREALAAVYRAELGIGEPTVLTAQLLEYFGQRRVVDLLHSRTARGSSPASVRHLAALVLDAAEAGDKAASAIVKNHGAIMGDYARAAARQVGIAQTAYPLVLAGGVLRHPSPLLAASIIERVRAESPAVRPVRARFEPVVGALLLAYEAAGLPVASATIAQLSSTLPPAALFVTANDAS